MEIKQVRKRKRHSHAATTTHTRTAEVRITPFKFMFMCVSQFTIVPLYVSPFFNSTDCMGVGQRVSKGRGFGGVYRHLQWGSLLQSSAMSKATVAHIQHTQPLIWCYNCTASMEATNNNKPKHTRTLTMVAVAGIKVCVCGQIHKLSKCCLYSLQFEVHRDASETRRFQHRTCWHFDGLVNRHDDESYITAHTHTHSTTLSLVDKEQGLYSCDL